MVELHRALGGLVILAFIVVTILNILRVTGRDLPHARTVSIIAAVLLLVQYLLGFDLLRTFSIPPAHYIIALLAILTVGMEHGYASTRDTSHQRALAATIATLATTVLVFIAYMIGTTSAAAAASLVP